MDLLAIKRSVDIMVIETNWLWSKFLMIKYSNAIMDYIKILKGIKMVVYEKIINENSII